MGFLYQPLTMEQLLGFVVLLAVVIALNELTRRYLKISLFVYIIVCIFLCLLYGCFWL